MTNARGAALDDGRGRHAWRGVDWLPALRRRIRAAVDAGRPAGRHREGGFTGETIGRALDDDAAAELVAAWNGWPAPPARPGGMPRGWRP